MKNFKTLLTDRKAREALKDKIEVAMAVVVLTGFAYKKYQERQNPQPIDAQESNS